MKEINKTHKRVYNRLVKFMKEADKDSEIIELDYKGAMIKYEAISLEDNLIGGKVITLYRTVGKKDIEVAKIILEEGTNYKVTYDGAYTVRLEEVSK